MDRLGDIDMHTCWISDNSLLVIQIPGNAFKDYLSCFDFFNI